MTEAQYEGECMAEHLREKAKDVQGLERVQLLLSAMMFSNIAEFARIIDVLDHVLQCTDNAEPPVDDYK